MKPVMKRIPFYIVLACIASCATSNELIFDVKELDVNPSPSMSSAVGDLDNDGDLDVLVVRKLNKAAIFINDGKGAFSLGEQEFPRLDLTDVGISDLDIVIDNSNIPDQVWLNDGIGVFTQATSTPEQPGSTAVIVGDFDADEDADVFFARYDGRETVWLNRHRD